MANNSLIDPDPYKATPEESAAAEQQELDGQEVAMRLEQLKEWYPEWFNYSDTLGERPIDGMLREMMNSYKMYEEQKSRDVWSAWGHEQQVKQNMQVAPEYTQEQQQSLPAGYVKPMGKVM